MEEKETKHQQTKGFTSKNVHIYHIWLEWLMILILQKFKYRNSNCTHGMLRFYNPFDTELRHGRSKNEMLTKFKLFDFLYTTVHQE